MINRIRTFIISFLVLVATSQTGGCTAFEEHPLDVESDAYDGLSLLLLFASGAVSGNYINTSNIQYDWGASTDTAALIARNGTNHYLVTTNDFSSFNVKLLEASSGYEYLFLTQIETDSYRGKITLLANTRDDATNSTIYHVFGMSDLTTDYTGTINRFVTGGTAGNAVYSMNGMKRSYFVPASGGTIFHYYDGATNSSTMATDYPPSSSGDPIAGLSVSCNTIEPYQSNLFCSGSDSSFYYSADGTSWNPISWTSGSLQVPTIATSIDETGTTILLEYFNSLELNLRTTTAPPAANMANAVQHTALNLTSGATYFEEHFVLYNATSTNYKYLAYAKLTDTEYVYLASVDGVTWVDQSSTMPAEINYNSTTYPHVFTMNGYFYVSTHGDLETLKRSGDGATWEDVSLADLDAKIQAVLP